MGKVIKNNEEFRKDSVDHPFYKNPFLAALDMNGQQVTNSADATSAKGLVTLDQLESTLAFHFDYFFNNTASALGGIYYQMTDSDLGGAESPLATGSLSEADDQALSNFITETAPGVTSLANGIYSVHTHVARTGGNRPTYIYAELYKRIIAGTETLLSTSDLSGLITTKTAIDLHFTIASVVNILTTDKLVIKFYANCGAGSASEITLYQEGNNSSHFSFNVSSAVLSDIFIRKDLFDANTMLYATSDNTPEAKTVAQLKTLLAFMTDLSDDTSPQLAANLDLNLFNIEHTAILTDDNTYQGEIITVDVDTNSVGFGGVLAQAADFSFDEADADAIANSYMLVVALEAGTGSKKVLLRGQVCDTAWTWSAGPIYLSTTLGTFTQTPPSGADDTVIICGFALSADTIYFNPYLATMEHTG